ncbi:uracil-DNA glycosylase [bacterium]|nr:uracil-DNA glycosylase [bacterium]
MDKREEAIKLLRTWVRQQHASGIERVVYDRDHEAGVLLEEKPVAVAEVETAIPALRDSLESKFPAWSGSELLPLAEEILACENCGLCESRTQAVPGVGNAKAKLVFVGEAPGAEEDRQGIPFVGRAGQLLDKILAAIDLSRDDVHILNILKCRPPENRNPAPDEIVACRPFLERQLEILEPKIIVGLGLFASQWLTGKKISLTKLRETGPHEYAGIQVYATYHPAALLRNPNWKRPAWVDFQAIRKEYDRL